jgi:hypothetical protein
LPVEKFIVVLGELSFVPLGLESALNLVHNNDIVQRLRSGRFARYSQFASLIKNFYCEA